MTSRPVWFLVCLAILSSAVSCSSRGRGGDDDDDDSGEGEGEGGEGEEGEPEVVSDEEACSYAATSRSYEGCEYVAVDLPNYPITVEGLDVPPAEAQFAVVVSNGDERSASRVRVLAVSGGDESEIDEAVVQPRSTHVFELPHGGISGTMTGGTAYRLVASRPVTAYQFNPLNNTDEAFSNDASLLIPTTALGEDYVAVTPDAGGSGTSDEGDPFSLGTFVAVVSVSSQETEVRVRPTSPLAGGAGVDVSGPEVTVVLAPYEVLNLESRAEPPPADGILPRGFGNLSGTRVTADGPVAVFAGSVCSFMPTGPTLSCCCDHTEEQMFPLASLGSTFVGAPSWDRAGGDRQPDLWRLTAGDESVTLQWVDRPDGAPSALDALESVEFESAAPFVVTADGRLQLTQFLTSSEQVQQICVDDFDCGEDITDVCYFGRCLLGCEPARGADDCPYLATCTEQEDGYAFCEAMGDPAMILVPPVEQYRSDYVFLTPDDYAHDFVSIVAPEGASVELDGQAIAPASFDPAGDVAGVPYRWSTLELQTDGTHIVTASAPVALVVYGYDRWVSYGYPAGLDLEELLY